MSFFLVTQWLSVEFACSPHNSGGFLRVSPHIPNTFAIGELNKLIWP